MADKCFLKKKNWMTQSTLEQSGLERPISPLETRCTTPQALGDVTSMAPFLEPSRPLSIGPDERLNMLTTLPGGETVPCGTTESRDAWLPHADVPVSAEKSKKRTADSKECKKCLVVKPLGDFFRCELD